MTMTPILNLSSLLDSFPSEPLVFWFSRMTLLAVLACAFLFAAQRLRPAVRHAVAVVGLLAIALLPLASALLPAWSIPVLPAPALQPMKAEPARTFLVEPTRDNRFRAVPVAATPSFASGPIQPARSEAAVSRARALLTTSVGWKNALILVWLNVMAALLLRVGMGAWSVRRFVRTAPVRRPDHVTRECARACRVLGIERPIDVIVSRHVTVPLVAGAFRPRVMLPAAAETWTRERLSAVLMHELAHVRRRDNLWVLLSRVVSAVFWFHPLVWIMSRELRRDAEHACDDIVLASGVRNSDYASHLVAIARVASTREVFAGAALTLGTRSSLEKRVVSILSTRTPCAVMSRRALTSLACVSLIMLVTIAAARPTQVKPRQATPAEREMMLRASNDALRAGNAALRAVAPVPGVTDKTAQQSLRTLKMSQKTLQTMNTRAALVLAELDDPSPELTQRIYAARDGDRESGRQLWNDASDAYHDDDWTAAARAYEQAAEFGYRRPVALYNAGCSWALAKQKDKAIAALQKSFDEGFDRPDLFAADDDLNYLRDDKRFQDLLARVMSSDSAELQRKHAQRDFDRLAKRNNVEEGEWNRVGIDLLRSGDYAGAADAFEREFKVSKDEDALYNKACARALAGNKQDALALLDQSIRTGSVNADHMGEDPDLVTLHSEKRFDELLTLAEDLELTPGKEWTWHWGKRGEERVWKRALPHFEEVARNHSDIGRAWFNLGFAQLKTGDAQSATTSFKKSLDMGYQSPTTMYNLACCAAQTGDTDDAFEWLRRADEAGFKMWRANGDDDLDPLRGDPRFKKYKDQWKSEWSSKHGVDFHYDYKTDDDSRDEDKNYD